MNRVYDKCWQLPLRFLLFRDGPLENLLGGAGEVQKKYSRKEKLNDK